METRVLHSTLIFFRDGDVINIHERLRQTYILDEWDTTSSILTFIESYEAFKKLLKDAGW